MSTLGDYIKRGDTITVYCNNHGCDHYRKLDLVALAGRLGKDHGAMHDDLIRYYYCSKCRDAGKPDKNITFIHSPDSTPKAGNPYLKAKGG